MGTESEVLFACPRCGEEGQRRVGQSVIRDDLLWYESVNCKQCNLHLEADGVGFPPEAIRERIISTNGRWKLVLVNVKSVPGVSKVLRQHLSLSSKGALTALRANSDEGIYRGTKAEALWLSNLLEKAGEVPQISRFD